MSTSLVISVPTERLAQGLDNLPPGVELVQWDLTTPAPREHIDIVVQPYMGAPAALDALQGVSMKLVQGQSIGYDGVDRHLPSGVPYANASGVHEASTAELTMALILAAQRGFPHFVAAQRDGQWSPIFTPSLADRRVLLVGFGGVGKAIAARLAPFEVELSAVARTARTESVPGYGDITVHAMDDLSRVVADAEIVVTSLPGTPETQHIFNAEMFARFADDTLFVNVGRGALVDNAALIAELQAGRLRAASDVFEQEPVPAGDPLWSAPNLLISPHVGGVTTAMEPRILRLIRSQIDRMLADQEPLNVVISANER
ncbi:2-hydroxyacid dehydrogenase [Microbacterium sp. YY-01]|uniref:2-hydroxyacid dehydrogenase n=1 Tax=Microbacterium sp. YY-01 TaxID=3421634 RepID=UPI003D162677